MHIQEHNLVSDRLFETLLVYEKFSKLLFVNQFLQWLCIYFLDLFILMVFQLHKYQRKLIVIKVSTKKGAQQDPPKKTTTKNKNKKQKK